MPALAIRPLVEGDLDALLTLYAELQPNDAPLPEQTTVEATWQAILTDRKIQCLGGFLGDALVSTCLLTIIPNLTRACRPYGLIENVVTTAAQRGRGYAKAMLQHACNISWQHGCYKVMLQTGRKDEATLQFYESAGFDRHAKQAFYAAAPV